MRSEALARAIRNRDVDRASAIIFELQGQMNGERLADLILLTIERLAWEEGDSPAARWLLRNSAAGFRRAFPLK
jgi:hypothetical protein